MVRAIRNAVLTIFFWGLIPFAADAQITEAEPSRVALVGDAAARNIVDLATVVLSETQSVQLVERQQIEAVLREQRLSALGLVHGGQAVQLAQLLAADLFAVLEMEPDGERLVGIVVFDVATGARLWDRAVDAMPAEQQATCVADAVRAAVRKARESHDIRTIGVLNPRNADLSRKHDLAVQAIGRLLERELLLDPRLVVLERDHLRHVVEERNLPTAEQQPPLLTSLLIIQTEVSRGAENGQWKATVQLLDRSGGAVARVTATAAAGDAYRLAKATRDALEQPLRMIPANGGLVREREAERFHRESVLLWRHGEHARAAQAAEAAFALNPAETQHLRTLVYRVLDAAIELVDPGRQQSGGPPRSSVDLERLERSLDLAQHALSLQKQLFDRLTSEAGWQDSLREFSAITFPIYLSKITTPDRQMPERIRGSVVEFVSAHREFQLTTIDRVLYPLAREREGYRRYCSWVARPAMMCVFRYYAPVREDWADDAARLVRRWAHVAEKHELSVDAQLMASSAWVLSEVDRLDRVAHISDEQYETLREAYRSLESAGHPLLQHYGVLLGVSLERHTHRIGEARLLETVQTLSTAVQKYAAPEAALITSQQRDVWINLAMSAHQLLPSDERTRRNRQLLDALLRQEVVSQNLLQRTLIGYQAMGRPREALELLERILEFLKSRPAGLAESRRTLIADLQSRRLRLRERLGVPAVESTAWDSVRTLIDVSGAHSGVRALAAPVVNGQSVYVLGMSWNEEQGQVKFTLLEINADTGTRRTLGAFTLRDLPAPTPSRSSPSADALTLHAVIERDTTRGSRFIPDAVIANGTYYAATMGRGILAFPIDGGQPKQIGEAAGIPSDFIHALSTHAGKLYAWAGELKSAAYLLCIDLAGLRTEVLAASRRAITRSPLDNTAPLQCDLMDSDPARDRIVFRLTNASSDENLGIWELTATQNTLRQLWRTPHFTSTTRAKSTGDPFILVRDGANLFCFDLRTNQASRRFREETRVPWTFMPVAIVGDWLWVGSPFGRVHLVSKRFERFPPLRAGTFQPGYFCRLAETDLLLADPAALWLLKLKGQSQEKADFE